MAPAPPPTSPEPAAEIAALERELKAVRDERRVAQKRVAESEGLDQVIARVRRDRSALTSPVVEQVREQVQRLHDQLDESWDSVDNARHMAARLARKGPHLADRAALQAALDAEAAVRREITEHLRGAGVNVRVPGADPGWSDGAR